MEVKFSEKLIQRRLWFHFLGHRYRFINIFFFSRNSECDFLSFYQSGYCQEIEIKTSVSDFRADFKKAKHPRMNAAMNLGFLYIKDKNIPNRFYYAVPRGLINIEDVPNYAGLIYIGKSSNDVVIVKKAPLIHKEKIDYRMSFNKTYYSYEDTTTIRLREV